MPTLHWIGKEAVTNHHKDVPYRMLEPDESLSHGDEDGDGNLIVQGDNLHALKALLPKYAGKVKCIYIDPPYNTGNEGWVYNDNVKAPEIQKWLGQVVGKEAEDLSRHDKWLCMMYPRLVLLREFLSEDGAIFVSIDDNEVASLRLLMDEIFGKQNFVADAIWQKKYARQNDSKTLSISHDHTIIYTKNLSAFTVGKIPRTSEQTKGYKNLDDDPRGLWQSVVYTCAKTIDERPNLYYPIENPYTKELVYPKKNRVWAYEKSRTIENQKNDLLWWGKTGQLEKPRMKSFLSNVPAGVVPDTLWLRDEVGDNQDARREVRDVLEYGDFSTPKPTRLIQRVLQIASDKDSLILDSFAGSGTTAHAVLKQNAEDGGNRKFILCEMEETIAENITSERVRRVANGYTDSKGKEITGLGGSFQYCRLSEDPLFNANGHVRPDVTFDQLAEFIWYNETGKGWHGWGDKKQPSKKDDLGPIFDQSGQIRSYPRGPLLGVENGHALVLLYNGILNDRSDLGGNVLTQRTLDYLRETINHEGPMTIFAARNRFANKRLRAQGITYKQLPYRIDT